MSSVIRGAQAEIDVLHLPELSSRADRKVSPAQGEDPVEQELNKAYRNGYEAGRREVEGAVEKRLGCLLEGLELLGQDLTKYKRDLLDQVQSQAVALSLAVARKIVGDRCREDKTLVVDIVRKALQRIADRDRVSLRVNPVSENQR